MKIRSLIFGLTLIGIIFTGCKGESTNQSSDKNKDKNKDKILLKSHANQPEYKKSSPEVKKIANHVDAAVVSLKALKMYDTEKSSDYYAIVTISRKGKESALANSIVISSDEGTLKDTKESCTACNFSEDLECYKQINSYMKKNDADEISLQVRLENGCAILTY